MPELETKAVVKEHGDVGLVYRERPWWSSVPVLGLLINAVSDLGTVVTSLGAGLYFQAISALVLVLYGALRSIEKILPSAR